MPPVRTPSARYPGVYSYDRNGKKLWGAIADLGRKPGTNQRNQRRKDGFATEKAAKQWRDEAIAEAAKGPVVRGGAMTLGQWWQDYIELHRSWSVYTRRNAERHLKWIAPLAGIRLQDLTVVDVRLWLDGITAKYAPSSSKKVYSQLREVLDMAVGEGYLGANVARSKRIEKPKGGSPEHESWTLAELEAFLAIVDQDPVKGPLFRFMAHTWVRVGEAIGLEWRDVDLVAGTVVIRRSASLLKGKIVKGGTKTGETRTLWLSPAMVELLRGERDRQKLARVYQEDGFVFGYGRFLSSGLLYHYMKRTCDAGDIRMIGLHGIRHTGGSLARANGWDYLLIQQRLGHKSAKVTMDLYMHVQADEFKGMAAALAV